MGRGGREAATGRVAVLWLGSLTAFGVRAGRFCIRACFRFQNSNFSFQMIILFF